VGKLKSKKEKLEKGKESNLELLEKTEEIGDSLEAIGTIGGALKEDVSKTKIADENEINEVFELEVSEESSVEISSELTLSDEKSKTKSVRKIRYFYVCIAAIMLFFAIIGAVNSTIFVTQRVDDIINRRALKEEFAFFIYPVVINDPPAFESVANLQDMTIILSAIWQIILIGDKTHFETDIGVIYIPATAVEAAARSLFGTGNLNHQSVFARGTDFIFSAQNNNYQIPENPPLFSYSPLVTEVTNVGETYTVTVDYMLPNPLAIAGIDHVHEPIKTMIYTISRNREGMTIQSIQIGEFEQW